MHIFFIFFAYPPTEDNLPISMKHYPTADMQDSAKIKLNSEARVYWVVEIFCTYIVIFVLEEWKIFSGQMDGIRCEFLLASMLGHLGTIFSLHTNSFWTLTTRSNILGWCLLSVIIVVPWMWKIKLTSKQKKKWQEFVPQFISKVNPGLNLALEHGSDLLSDVNSAARLLAKSSRSFAYV